MQPPVDATSDGSSTAGPVRLAQVFAELGAALAAPAPSLAKLRAWGQAAVVAADSTARRGLSIGRRGHLHHVYDGASVYLVSDSPYRTNRWTCSRELATSPRVTRWRASAAGFEEQKHRLFHHFTNRTGHRLTLAGKWLDSGQWLEPPRAALAT
jgi:hypothetical protein